MGTVPPKDVPVSWAGPCAPAQPAAGLGAAPRAGGGGGSGDAARGAEQLEQGAVVLLVDQPPAGAHL